MDLVLNCQSGLLFLLLYKLLLVFPSTIYNIGDEISNMPPEEFKDQKPVIIDSGKSIRICSGSGTGSVPVG